MKKILYLSNIEVPYRVRILNGIAKQCDLTVLYERRTSDNRNSDWTSCEKGIYRTKYLRGIKFGNENAFSLGIIKHIFSKYDCVVVGCYNSPCQMFAVLLMRLFGIPFIINTDGEVYVEGDGLKAKIKRFFLSGAKGYLSAGENSSKTIKRVSKNAPVLTYYFSSLSEAELESHAEKRQKRNDTVLVVGQYFSYKGMDLALSVAKKNSDIKYKFVGMGNRTELFIKEQCANSLPNVELVPFLSKDELEAEYSTCGALLLPSRKECWGLVVNEAASFGMPIVSTRGSGAAVEFLSEDYPMYLAEPDSVDDIYEKLVALLSSESKEQYGDYLINKSSHYSIEKAVETHIKLFETV